jgi:hypothetical protein
MLAIISIGVIWVVGSGDAATHLGDIVYEDLCAGGTGTGTRTDGGSKHSIAYYTKLMADIACKIHMRYVEDVNPEVSLNQVSKDASILTLQRNPEAQNLQRADGTRMANTKALVCRSISR